MTMKPFLKRVATTAIALSLIRASFGTGINPFLAKAEQLDYTVLACSCELNASAGISVHVKNGDPVTVDHDLTLTGFAADIDGATVAIRDYQGPGDSLSFASGTNGIAGHFDVQTGILTLNNSGPASEYEAALRSVTFSTAGEVGERTIDFFISTFEATKVVMVIAPPSVNTAAATSISTTSATLGGEVTADNFAEVTARGVVYTTSQVSFPGVTARAVVYSASDSYDDLIIGGNEVFEQTIGAGTGVFSQTIGSLAPDTTYFFRSYATNSAGTSYGDVLSFTTEGISPPVVISVDAPAGTYAAGQHLDFAVTFSESVTVDTAGGIPRIHLDFGGNAKYAYYVSGSESDSLLFRYTIECDDAAPNGVFLDSLNANGATIRNESGVDADLTFNSTGQTGIFIDVNDDPVKDDITGVSFTDATFTYDGTARSISISGNLPDGTSVSYTNNTGINAGIYDAVASISGGANYNDLTLNATLTIEKANITGITFGNLTVNYHEQGSAESIIRSRVVLPPGVSLNLLGLPITWSVGTFSIVAVIDGGSNYNDLTLHASLRILSPPPPPASLWLPPSSPVTGTGPTVLDGSSGIAPLIIALSAAGSVGPTFQDTMMPASLVLAPLQPDLYAWDSSFDLATCNVILTLSPQALVLHADMAGDMQQSIMDASQNTSQNESLALLEALASGEDISSVLTSATSDSVFHDALLEALAMGLSPADAIAVAQSTAEAIASLAALLVDSSSFESDLLEALALGVDIGPIIGDALASGADFLNLLIGSPDVQGDTPPLAIIVPESVLGAANGMTITITSFHGTVSVQPDAIAAASTQGKPLVISMVEQQVEAIADLLPVGTEPVSAALSICTDMTGPTWVAINMGIELSEDELMRKAFLNELMIYSIHSDGKKEMIYAVNHNIEETPYLDEQGVERTRYTLQSATFWVSYFSRFVVVQPNQQHLETTVGVPGFAVAGKSHDMVASYYKGNDTFMPVRMLEAFGVNLFWSEESRTAFLVYRDKVVELTIGSTNAMINGVPTPIYGASGMLLAPELAPGRTMVPLRFVSEHLGFKVTWDESNLITIANN